MPSTRFGREGGSSTKLKWNMLLQQTAPKSGKSDSRTPSPLLTNRDPVSRHVPLAAAGDLETESTNVETVKEESSEKIQNTAVDESGEESNSSSTSRQSVIENLRSSLGSFDWKVVGQSVEGEEEIGSGGHSRERAMSLLERVSGCHLLDNEDGTPDDAPIKAPIATPMSARPSRVNSIFSPFPESSSLNPPASAAPDLAYFYQSSEPQSSRSSSPAINHSMYAAEQNNSAPMLPSYDPMRRQSLMDVQHMGQSGGYSMMQNPPRQHRPSLSYSGYPQQHQQQYPMRSGSVHHRATPSPPLPHPISAYQHPQQQAFYSPRRGSVPYPQSMDYYYDPMIDQQQHFSPQQFSPHPAAAHYPHNHQPGYHHAYGNRRPSAFAAASSFTPPPSMYNDAYNDPAFIAESDQHSQQQQPPKEFQLSSYHGPMYAVEFKAGRTEVFYVLDGPGQLKISPGSWVIVEADRGEDLGKVTCTVGIDRLQQLISLAADAVSEDGLEQLAATLEPELAPIIYAKEIIPKQIYRLATHDDMRMLQVKAQEEAIAMVRCQSRIRQKRLPMEVVDAEYQWDRNKLTFFFQSDKRIDFRELVRDLFRIYKTRIWMCAVDRSRLAALAEMRKHTTQADIDAVHAAALAADRELSS